MQACSMAHVSLSDNADSPSLLQWHQDCLAYLLRLMSQFAVTQSDLDTGQDDVFEQYESPRKRQRRRGQEKVRVLHAYLTHTHTHTHTR